jgi:GNAT superfamily N-acetyltransferase
MLTLAAVAATPGLIDYSIQLRDGRRLRYRPLLPTDVEALTDFLTSLSPLTRHRWYLPSYDRVMAQELCDAIGRYDKLRLVAEEPDNPSAGLVALFELSFGIPDGDHARFARYGIKLDEAHDVRFGPCVRDADQGRGVASALMEPTLAIVRRFGKTRILLWGGVLTENEPARTFYRRHGFVEVGHFRNSDGQPCIDMMLTMG